MTKPIEIPADDEQDALWRLPEVMERTGLSKTEIYRRMAAKTFPQNAKLSPRVAVWQKSAVLNFVRSPFLDNEARDLV